MTACKVMFLISQCFNKISTVYVAVQGTRCTVQPASNFS